MITTGNADLYRTRSLKVTDALALPHLVARNADDLRVDFPGVVKRYASVPKAFRAIRNAQANPHLRAFTIRYEEEDYDVELDLDPGTRPVFRRYPVGMATLHKGQVDIPGTGDSDTLSGVVVAGWLDREHRQKNVASTIATQLLPQALAYG